MSLGNRSYPIGTILNASICRRGHVIERDRHCADDDPGFCGECGERVFSRCQTCTTPIPGLHYAVSKIVANFYVRPSFCRRCGSPFPWTEWALAELDAAVDDERDISPEDKTQVKQDLRELTKSEPSPSAVKRVGSFAKKLLNDPSTRQIAVNVISDAAKIILGQGK